MTRKYVSIENSTKKHKILSRDIKMVHKAQRRQLPRVPAFENKYQDETEVEMEFEPLYFVLPSPQD